MNQKQDVSGSELKFIFEGCRDNCRQDGRARHEYRSYSAVASSQGVETNLTKNPPLVLSQGSARVFLSTGETHILVSVKAELVRPAADRHDHGVISVHVDTGSRYNDELEQTINTLLVPHLLDSKNLCIVPGLYAWKLNIDVLVLDSAGGSLLDACSLAINKALLSTILPSVTFHPSQNDEKGSLRLDPDFSAGTPVSKELSPPIIITATMLKSPSPIFILDATKAEEACAYAQIHIVVDMSGDEPKICALQTSGNAPLSLSVFQDATSFVLESAPKTFALAATDSSPELLLQSTFVLQEPMMAA